MPTYRFDAVASPSVQTLPMHSLSLHLRRTSQDSSRRYGGGWSAVANLAAPRELEVLSALRGSSYIESVETPSAVFQFAKFASASPSTVLIV